VPGPPWRSARRYTDDIWPHRHTSDSEGDFLRESKVVGFGDNTCRRRRPLRGEGLALARERASSCSSPTGAREAEIMAILASTPRGRDGAS